MYGELKRYFIELQYDDTVSLPRSREIELRRQQAADFINTICHWLKEQELDDKVTALAITTLGQVQITCEEKIIQQIRGQEMLPIAMIRSGSIYPEHFNRWSDVR